MVVVYILSLYDEFKGKGVCGCVFYLMGVVDIFENCDEGMKWDVMIDLCGFVKSVVYIFLCFDCVYIIELKVYLDEEEWVICI